MLTGEEGQGQFLGWAEQRRRLLAGMPAQKEHSWVLLSESHLMGLRKSTSLLNGASQVQSEPGCFLQV